MTFEEAATLPHSAILAVQGLRRRDGRTIRPGDKVLIDGASGNVGPFAVQIAKAIGAEVTAVCSAGKIDFVRSLGADHVLDYTRSTTRGPASATTGSSTRTRITPSSDPARAATEGVYVTLGGTGRPLLAALALGPADLAGHATAGRACCSGGSRSRRRTSPRSRR